MNSLRLPGAQTSPPGKANPIPWESMVWMHEHISGSRVEIFEEDEGGKHFMFMENPEKFNRLIADFIG